MKTIEKPNKFFVWEENDLIEPTTKLENSGIIVLNDITNETKKEFLKKECEDIGSKKRWKKICPNCGCIQQYTSKYRFENAAVANLPCRKCASKKRGNNHQTKENYIGKNFSKLTIIDQYVGKNNVTRVKCLCSCGKITSHRLCSITNGYIRSCGCQRIETLQQTNSCCKRKIYGLAAFNTLYYDYKSNASDPLHMREFKLSKEDAMKLFKGNCFYCGSPPSKIRKRKRMNGEFVYNGIDRKDSTKGYTLDNCVSCCTFCNLTKRSTSFDEFIKWIRCVYENTKNVNLSTEKLDMVKLINYKYNKKRNVVIPPLILNQQIV